jgi:hypothetical protein
MNKYIIHLQLHSKEDVEIVNTNDLRCWDEEYIDTGEFVYYSPTLKDISIILECLVGQGVVWQLGRELSKRTGFDLNKIDESLSSIIREYTEMSDEKAIEKWEETKYIE